MKENDTDLVGESFPPKTCQAFNNLYEQNSQTAYWYDNDDSDDDGDDDCDDGDDDDNDI